MITNFEEYQSRDKIKIGGYVIVDIKDDYINNKYPTVPDFLRNNIGEVVGISKATLGKKFLVKYEKNIPKNSKDDNLYIPHNTAEIYEEDISIYSDSKKELEIYISSKKYNI